MTKTPWRIAGDAVSICICAWGCPCQFNALPTHGRCEALEMGNCVESRATLGDKTISTRNSYAQFASVDWTNA